MPSASITTDTAGHDGIARPTGWLLAYLAFVIYGSLVPLDFQPHSLAWAWARFEQIPMYRLGIESRADWIANGVLYVPVGFLFGNLLAGRRQLESRVARLALAMVLSCCLAIGVEFAQIFFPPRTVSLNDLLAEVVGSAVGIVVAAYGTAWFRALISARFRDHTRFLDLLLQVYLFFFLALALFPYDFVLSTEELAAKAASTQWGWWRAEVPAQWGLLRVLLQLAIEVSTALPVGVLVARRNRLASGRAGAAFRFGLLLGLAIEVAQFFIYSGRSQGLSLLTRGCGCWLGAVLWQHRERLAEGRIAGLVRRLTVPLAPVYLFSVLALNGWFSRHWQGMENARAALAELRFLPFYYHYFTTEAHALSSLVSVAGQYAPFGVLAWAFRTSLMVPAVGAFLLALVVETGRLFIAGGHPDPTNVLIAPAAAVLTALVAAQLARSLQAENRAAPAGLPLPQMAAHHRPANGRGSTERLVRTPATGRQSKAGRWVALALAVLATLVWLANFPLQPVIMALLLTAFAVAVWFRPPVLVALLPAALPVFDLAPWSGPLLIDEFDILMLLGLAIAYVRTPQALPGQAHDVPLTACLGLLALSVGIGVLMPLLPWPAIDLNAFSGYFSPFNGLRIGKGLLWALLFWGLLRRLALGKQPVFSLFARGMATGLLFTVAIVLWERSIYGGLASLDSDYRVTGPFSAMHVGGAYIECFFTVAVPFLIFLLAGTSSRVARLFGVGLLLLSTFALMLTFSRNGYLAFAISSLLALAAALLGGPGRLRRVAPVLALGVAMVVVAVPIFAGRVAQDRIARAGVDLDARLAHWRGALAMRDDGLATLLIGMGLGRYPEIHYWRSIEPGRSASFRLERESDNTFLRLSAGQPIYIEQIVSIPAGLPYRLRVDVRSAAPAAGSVVVAVCEKWMLTSANCAGSIEAPLANASGSWQHFEQPIDVSRLTARPWFARGPVKLTVYSTGQTAVDIDALGLRAGNGLELIDNGDFSQGMASWFFASDSHLSWHSKSLPVALLFDQGWLGALAVTAFAALSLIRASRRAVRGDLAAATAGAALVGFLVLGLFDTLIDAPRFLFLFIVLGVLSSVPRSSPAARR